MGTRNPSIWEIEAGPEVKVQGESQIYISSLKASLGCIRPYFKETNKEHRKISTPEGHFRTSKFSGAMATSKHCTLVKVTTAVTK